MAGALPEKRCMRVGVACKISQIILAVCAGKCYNGTRVNLHLAGKCAAAYDSAFSPQTMRIKTKEL